MFDFLKPNQRRQGGRTNDDRRIDEMMNEVGQELGVNKNTREPMSREKANQLADRTKEEIKQRTSK
ncbi:hypothetical protein [Paludifilum halophilum]|uniref:Uncharacterized protein n=1 Tax=Paludifilum halophilum TaxID=1642702 RepID=A0A235B6C8_9BACL|nr:hypothetical protein [Paludifilum halophilum]OYD07791.1 hypothetical protein CHM34_10025 [Paludifilum halophilum]